MTERTDRDARAKATLTDDLRALGFDAVAVTDADAPGTMGDRLRQALSDGHHASMAWMADTAHRRASPRQLWPEARSVVMVAMNYGPDDSRQSLDALAHTDCGTISVYAQNRDYHDVMKGKLKQAAGRFAARFGAEVKVFVDTAPLMEKPLAQQAGLGWQGKHTNLVSRRLGSWFFLGAIMTDRTLPIDKADSDHCGTCRACLDICPTDAFPAPYRLDARRCISYLTIEHAGMIPLAFRAAMGNRIYGCDDCLAICPWNKFATTASEAKLRARDDLKSPPLRTLLALDDTAFRTLFSGSPIKRIGRNRFIRNCLIAAGNSGARELVPLIEALMDDDDEVVRATAVWALAAFLTPERLHALARVRLARETSDTVRAEWSAALGDA